MTSITAAPAPIIRFASLIALTMLAVVLAAAPAAAQVDEAYPPEPEITITTPGATIIIEGRSWRAGTQVTIVFNNPSGQTFSATAVADENGTIQTDVPVPDDTEPGTLAVAFKGTGADGSPREEQGTVQVVSPDADAPSADGSSNAVLSLDGGDVAGAAGSASAADASEQVALGQTDIRRANATVPTTSQFPTLLAIALMGAGMVSLFGARRALARRSAQ